MVGLLPPFTVVLGGLMGIWGGYWGIKPVPKSLKNVEVGFSHSHPVLAQRLNPPGQHCPQNKSPLPSHLQAVVSWMESILTSSQSLC